MGEVMGLREVRVHERNARVHTERNKEMIERSIKENGFGRPILVSGDGVVLAGNATYEALLALGMEEAIVIESDGRRPVVHRRLDLRSDDPRALELAVWDNRAAELALWDVEELRRLEEEGVDLGKFWTDEEFERLVVRGSPAWEKPVVREEEVEVGEEEVGSGEVWRCGGHYVMCGDAGEWRDVERLIGLVGGRADVVVTSPPYGVGKAYGGGVEDSLGEWRGLMERWLGCWSRVSVGAAINIGDVKVGEGHREVHTYGELVRHCEGVGWRLIGTRIWSKNPVWFMGAYYTSSYRAVDDFEYIGIFGDIPYKARLGPEDEWRHRGVWQMGSVAANAEHPAMFPLELPTRLIRMLTDRGDVVADPFLGSGTTMLAAERLGRVCVGMEINPKYVALALARWREETGVEPERVD